LGTRYNFKVSNSTENQKELISESALLDRNLNEPSAIAESLLDNFIEAESPEEKTRRQLQSVAIQDARVGKKVIFQQSDRTQSRVLFVTENLNYLEENSRVVSELKLLSIIFDEIHVFVLSPIGDKENLNRINDNVWVYKVGYRFWWRIPFTIRNFASQQLMFSDSFRPDIVVALEPYLAGLVGLRIAKKFERPFQIHLTEDCFSPLFKTREKKNAWRQRLAKWVIPRSDSQRVITSGLKDFLIQKFKLADTISVLPQFHNFSSLMNTKPAFNLHEVYKQFSFIILAFADLKLDSPLQDVFSGLHQILHNPRVGLVVVGDGGAQGLYAEKAKLLGIEQNVVINKNVEDKLSYLQTADMLIQTNTSKDSEALVLQAAAAGLPMVMYETELRKDLFQDGETASICEVGDTYGLAKEVNNFLNNPSLRKQYSTGTKYMVATRLEEDESTYYQAYRDSIETAIKDARRGSS
jgi:glycosyltransferase involved in cell wall biosynthesis